MKHASFHVIRETTRNPAVLIECGFVSNSTERARMMTGEFRNRIAEGKLPACAEMCATKALLAGDAAVISDIYRDRVLRRGKGSEAWGWNTAYGNQGNKEQTRERTQEQKREGSK